MECLSKTGHQSIRKGSDESYEIINSITQVVAWLSGSALVSINEVTLRRAG